MPDHSPNVLVIDTATDACSVAVQRDGQVESISEVIPRQHSQRLFGMLRELLPSGDMTQQNIELLAYNHGPGSFTGLRIAASAIQGLAFSHNLPIVGVSTLECIAEGARRSGDAAVGETILVILDARIGEVYWALFKIEATNLSRLHIDAVCSAAEVLSEIPDNVKVDQTFSGRQPDPVDLINLAVVAWEQGQSLSAEEVVPVYVRNEISWKKLAEQGPQ